MKKTKKVLALTLLLSLPVNAMGFVGNDNEAISYAASTIDFGIKTDSFESKALTYNLKKQFY